MLLVSTKSTITTWLKSIYAEVMTWFFRYKIMRKCWLPNPKDRPTFSQLTHEIKDMITMLEQAMGQGDDQPDIQTTYVNMENCTDYHYTDELMPPPDSDDESSAPTSPRSPTSPGSPMSPGSPTSPVQPQSPTAGTSGSEGIV